MPERSASPVWFVATAIFCAATDLLSKSWVHNRLDQVQGELVLIPNFLRLIKRFNEGGMWSALAGFGATANTTLAIFSSVAIVVLILGSPLGWWPKDRRSRVVLGAILGGAIGNFYDRVQFGAVRDFIDAHYYDLKHWPTFNLADSYLVCGALLLFLGAVRSPKPVETTSDTGAAPVDTIVKP